MIVDIPESSSSSEDDTPVTPERVKFALANLNDELSSLLMAEANPEARPDLSEAEIRSRIRQVRGAIVTLEEHAEERGWTMTNIRRTPVSREDSWRPSPSRSSSLQDLLEDDDEEEIPSVSSHRRRSGLAPRKPSRPRVSRYGSSTSPSTHSTASSITESMIVRPHVAGLSHITQALAERERVRDSYHPPGGRRLMTQMFWRFISAGLFGAASWLFEMVVGRGHIPADPLKRSEYDEYLDYDDDEEFDE